MKKTVKVTPRTRKPTKKNRPLKRRPKPNITKKEPVVAVRKQRGSILVSNIPHGFYEQQMREYFQQFGKVTALRMPRSKTGKCRGFAFVEFRYKEVAKVAAGTMNNYLMFDKLLKVKYVSEKNRVRYPNRMNSLSVDNARRVLADARRKWDIATKNAVKKCTNRVDRFQRALQQAGVNYNLPVNDGGFEQQQHHENGMIRNSEEDDTYCSIDMKTNKCVPLPTE